MAALVETESSPQRKQFGNRYLTDPGRVFQHNAWDNVEWSEEQEAAARKKVEENCVQVVSPEKQVEYEDKANSYWNDFYKIHENRFFKDRHWLFTEFPELVPNCKSQLLDKARAAPAASDHRHAQPQSCRDRTVGNGSHLPQMCAEEAAVCTQEQNNLQIDVDSVRDGQETDRLADLSSGGVPQMRTQLSETELLDTDYSGASATFRILEVGCGVGNTVFPILQTNNDPGLFVYCCDFSSAAVELVKLNPGYDPSRCLAFVHDLCDTQANYPMPNESLDIIILIFVLSAIHPDKMQAVIKRLSQLLKPGGMILFRDYGRYDMAQLRFKKD
ncbi:tRNA N(3)-cytidine methyltransferase METTL2B-like isoform X1 [Mustelus asterias]